MKLPAGVAARTVQGTPQVRAGRGIAPRITGASIEGDYLGLGYFEDGKKIGEVQHELVM